MTKTLEDVQEVVNMVTTSMEPNVLCVLNIVQNAVQAINVPIVNRDITELFVRVRVIRVV